MSLYYSPVYYGINDVVIPDNGGGFSARIYYPSDEMEVRDAPIRDGTYPLIAFAHGDRSAERDLCPADRTEDYRRWGAVLHLLARCGFVVISLAVHEVVNDSLQTAVRIETAIRWARGSWAHRGVLFRPPVMYLDPDVMLAEDGQEDLHVAAGLARGLGHDHTLPLGPPTNLGVMGHSWGARAAARVAVRGKVEVTAIASIAGSWDENDSIRAMIDARDPTLMIAGTDDFLNASSLQGLWNNLARPKHQAMLQNIGHWDWFGNHGSIRPCDDSAVVPACPVAWQTASELVLAFMTKYLLNNWWRPPYLLGSPGGRPPLLTWYDRNGPCAVKVRWDDPSAGGMQGQTGEITLGDWSAPTPW